MEFTPDTEKTYTDQIEFVSDSDTTSVDHDPILEITASAIESPSQPTLLLPTNKDTNITVSNMAFSWEENQDIDYYTIQISKNLAFSIIIVETAFTNSYNLASQTLDYSTKYYWRVRSNREDISSDWSEIWSFTTESESSIFDDKNIELISITPNPAVNVITINLDIFTSAKIYNQNGNLVKEATTKTINVSDFARGKYFIIISTDEGIKHGEFIKD